MSFSTWTRRQDQFGHVRRDVDVVWDLGLHDLSIVDHVLPPDIRPVSISAVGTDPIGVGRCCVAYLNLTLSNGAIAHINVNWLSPVKVRTVTIGGSNRTVVWDHLNPMYRLAIFDRGVDVALDGQLDQEERRNLLILYRSGGMVAPALPEREALQDMVEEFARAIRTGEPGGHRRPRRPSNVATSQPPPAASRNPARR